MCFKGKEKRKEVKYFDFGGDNFYLVVPRYKGECFATSSKDGRKEAVYNGEAFIVCCEDKSVEVAIDFHGGCKFVLGRNSDNIMKIDGNFYTK